MHSIPQTNSSGQIIYIYSIRANPIDNILALVNYQLVVSALYISHSLCLVVFGWKLLVSLGPCIKQFDIKRIYDNFHGRRSGALKFNLFICNRKVLDSIWLAVWVRFVCKNICTIFINWSSKLMWGCNSLGWEDALTFFCCNLVIFKYLNSKLPIDRRLTVVSTKNCYGCVCGFKNCLYFTKMKRNAILYWV